MYVDEVSWSVPDDGDPPPCFRQGDLVALTWARPQMLVRDGGATVKLESLEVRTEVVALIGACCDLVDRANGKRKGVLVSPVRDIPKNIARSETLMTGLRASAAEAVERNLDVPANLFFYDTVEGQVRQPSVIFLESVASVTWDVMKSARKVAELTTAQRHELQERIKHHFTRAE